MVCLSDELGKKFTWLVVNSFLSDNKNGEDCFDNDISLEASLVVVAFPSGAKVEPSGVTDCLGCLDEGLGKNATRLVDVSPFNSCVTFGDSDDCTCCLDVEISHETKLAVLMPFLNNELR